MIRLLVIEDNANIIVPGLRNLFRPERDGIRIACFASDPDEALLNGKAEDFDVILLDLWIPGFLPTDNLQKLGAGFPHKPVMVYTQDDSPVWRRKMLMAGAKGYLTKSATREELKMAIEWPTCFPAA
jgi:DNA-binding NarL/FixJ family response regulator